MENILVLQQISKKFGQQYALTDVSLTIKKVKFTVLSGKMEPEKRPSSRLSLSY